MTKRYRWTSETTRVRQATGERFNAGDEIEPTDHELRAFSDYLELIEDVDVAESDDEDDIENVTEDITE